MDHKPLEIKVEINPSYEWSEDVRDLNISHRELEVLALVVEGYKNKEIAQILKIQHQSVKNHLQHLFKKRHEGNRDHLGSVQYTQVPRRAIRDLAMPQLPQHSRLASRRSGLLL